MCEKITDDEIIRVLECYANEYFDCEKCQVNKYCNDDTFEMFHCILDLITRHNAKIKALVSGQETLQKFLAEKNAEIERYKGVIKILEMDIATKTETTKELENFLIDKGKKGIIYVSDIPNYVIEFKNKCPTLDTSVSLIDGHIEDKVFWEDTH